MKIEIDSSKILTTLLGAAIIGAFAWMWRINERVARIESPSSMVSRVETLEKLTFPIAVEFEVRKRVEAETTGSEPVREDAPERAMPPRVRVPPNTAVDPKLREAAEDDIRAQLEQRPLNESKKRRGKPIEFKKKD